MSVTYVRVAVLSPEPLLGAAIQVREIRVTADIWRRHRPDCKLRKFGRNAIRCDCPLWGEGYIESQRVLRKSLDTRSLEHAQSRLNELIASFIRQKYPQPVPAVAKEIKTEAEAQPQTKPLDATVPEPSATTVPIDANDPRLIRNTAKAFLANCQTNGIKPPTLRKYRNTLNKLTQYAESAKVKKPFVDAWEVIDLDAFRADRGLAKITSSKELELLRQYWEFCTVRSWCPKNIARLIKAPHITDQNEVVPYTKRDQAAILSACETFGRNDYERKRARAMILTLRNTALRISDVALLQKDRISRDEKGVWRVFLHTTKNNARVYLPVPPEMLEALNALPAPRGSKVNCEFYFWNGNSKPKSMISVAEETLQAVFAKSGVEDAGAHRYRHTLATELLEAGATYEEVADILGNSVDVVKKHYAKWGQGRQRNIDRLMRKVRGGGLKPKN
jgi:site-specific recombinase XerD